MTDMNLPVLENEEPATRRGGLNPASLVLLIGVLAVIGVFGWALIQRQQMQPTAGPAPDFALTTYDGQEIRLSDLRGNVVVVNFWASWCGPCRVEAPDLESIHNQYKDRGVVVVGVAYTDTDTNALAFIDEFSLTYPNGPDRGTRISDRYNIQGVPETFLVDQQGNIVWVKFAPTSLRELTPVLDQLLGA